MRKLQTIKRICLFPLWLAAYSIAYVAVWFISAVVAAVVYCDSGDHVFFELSSELLGIEAEADEAI